ncbi:sulfite reductase (NADPH) hemoprotein beta-component/sulfite reductase (ferredoxin) [Mariprofundus ferrinatatus]|uniref:Sulfite reductase (NADPH) hemoprotein beta-component/sulfite reductase (Ferredoxin) n=1 Tax=Mariprofundus ferrinatatus TaxID=1921087 RepID=A0A2K8L1U4_9PROT|nr:sulfurtransferase TusA family protein [Mariprofundus ferrinatatus]ATX81278.1 sulfite reductase (NADPH) hemoprotein beta-component/sulfite reductase (ferredoxin) [Mariprofundus ferrinatatus]
MATEFDFARTSDVDEFDAGYRAFKEGRMSEERFTPFRLQMGVYGQRQEGVQMVRAKLPGGCVTPDQMDVIAECVELYAGRLPTDGTVTEPPEKVAHVTTRQDIQANFVSLDDVPAFLRKLDAAGLTTREACGNTVRNVTTCFLAGRCPAEHADVTIHARKFAEFFLRHPLGQQFPRKFKVTFSGCATDCGLSGMHDIGFIATHKDGKPGFQVWAAGGLSSQPMGALLLEEFIEESELFVVGEALMRIHFKYSDRKRRARARMKYVAQKLGAEGFIEEYKKQRAIIEKTHADDSGYSEANWRSPSAALPFSDSGVVDQHNGKKAILLNLFRGDLTPEQCRAVASAARAAGTDELRVTTEQGMVICDVDGDKVDAALAVLTGAGLSSEYARGISDVVACPGTETCRLGITSSRGLAAALQPLMSDLKKDGTLAGITVKASGCQHSCGRHHIADLGFHGMAKKVAGQAVPHYQLHVGGSGVAGSPLAFATDPVPAKHAPEAGIAVLNAYKTGRTGDESMHDWASRIGKEGISAILAPFAADAGEVEGLIYDWSENEAFNTKGNKKGECAGAVLSMSDALISEAEYELLIARAHADAMFWGEALTALRRSAISAARAYLVPYGEAPEDDAEVFGLLAQHAVVDVEVIGGFHAVQNALMSIDLADPGAGVTKLKEVQGAWVKLAAKRFAAVPQERVEDAAEVAATGPSEDVVLLDLSGVACPMNFVKTKIKLSMMAEGSQLDVILDDGAPIENVPLSLEEQGQKVLAKEKISDSQWKIRVEKSGQI